MIENAFYSQENHGPYEFFDLGDFDLESGTYSQMRDGHNDNQ